MNRVPGDFEQPLPHNRDAELVALGGMMLSWDAIAAVTGILHAPADFYLPAHQVIYEAILWCANQPGENGHPPPHDAIAVQRHLQRTGQLAKCGGGGYLHTVLASVPTSANAGYYANLIREEALARDMITEGTRIVQAGWSSALDYEDRVDVLYRLADAASGAAARPAAVHVAELLPPALDRIEAGPGERGVETGWSDLDALTGGLRPGQFVIVAARPTIGKSTVLHHVAAEAAVGGHCALLCTMEMTRQEVIERWLAARGPVFGARLRDGLTDDEDWAAMAPVASVLSDAPLYLNDAGYQTLTSIRADLRRLRRAKTPVRVLLIDYVQLMVHAGGKAENREREVAEISRGLKLLAKDFDLTVIAAAQLNRGPEMRADHEPLMADLRNSGTLEQDADMVILLAREDAYDAASPRAGEIDLIVAKFRGGRTGRITMAHDAGYTRISDMGVSWDPARALTRLPPSPGDPGADERTVDTGTGEVTGRQPPF